MKRTWSRSDPQEAERNRAGQEVERRQREQDQAAQREMDRVNGDNQQQ